MDDLYFYWVVKECLIRASCIGEDVAMGHFKAVTIDMLSLIDTLLWKQNFVVDVVASKSEEKFMFKDEGSSL